jgi:single-strand DNA-binding protein
MELIIIAGRVGQDATIKEFNGNQYTAFSLAVDDSYKNAEGTKVEKTNWYSCLKSGTGLAPYIKKGQYLTVTGKPQSKLFKDSQGQHQISLNVNVNQVDLGPSPSTGQADQSATYTPREPYQNTSNPVNKQPVQGNILDEMANDDLPF